MKNKMEEAVDEHGQLFGKSAKTEKVLKNWRKTNISAKSGCKTFFFFNSVYL